MIALFATFADKNRNKRKSIPGPHPHVLSNRTTHSLRILQRYPAIFDFLLFRLSETLTLGRKRATRGPSFTFNQPRRFDHDLADLACRRSTGGTHDGDVDREGENRRGGNQKAAQFL